MLVGLLALLLRRRRVRLRLVVLSLLVVVRRLQVVMRGGGMVRRRLMMALVGRMLRRRGHVGPTFPRVPDARCVMGRNRERQGTRVPWLGCYCSRMRRALRFDDGEISERR